MDAPEFINGWLNWSADSRRIIHPVGRTVADGILYSLWIASLDATEHYEIELDDAINPWWVSWSPDGSHLALTSVRGGRRFRVLEPGPAP